MTVRSKSDQRFKTYQMELRNRMQNETSKRFKRFSSTPSSGSEKGRPHRILPKMRSMNTVHISRDRLVTRQPLGYHSLFVSRSLPVGRTGAAESFSGTRRQKLEAASVLERREPNRYSWTDRRRDSSQWKYFPGNQRSLLGPLIHHGCDHAVPRM